MSIFLGRSTSWQSCYQNTKTRYTVRMYLFSSVCQTLVLQHLGFTKLYTTQSDAITRDWALQYSIKSLLKATPKWNTTPISPFSLNATNCSRIFFMKPSVDPSVSPMSRMCANLLSPLTLNQVGICWQTPAPIILSDMNLPKTATSSPAPMWVCISEALLTYIRLMVVKVSIVVCTLAGTFVSTAVQGRKEVLVQCMWPPAYGELLIISGLSHLSVARVALG